MGYWLNNAGGTTSVSIAGALTEVKSREKRLYRTCAWRLGTGWGYGLAFNKSGRGGGADHDDCNWLHIVHGVKWTGQCLLNNDYVIYLRVCRSTCTFNMFFWNINAYVFREVVREGLLCIYDACICLQILSASESCVFLRVSLCQSLFMPHKYIVERNELRKPNLSVRNNSLNTLQFEGCF